MANIRNGNTFFIDTVAANAVASTTGNLAVKGIRVKYILISGIGASPQFKLSDVTTGTSKLRLWVANNETLIVNLCSAPMIFPNGIYPSTVTNVSVTLILEEAQR